MRMKRLLGIVVSAVALIPIVVFAAGTWTTKAPAPTGRTQEGNAPVIDGKIYLVGGSNLSGTNLSTEIYDPVTNTWSSGAPVGNIALGLAVAINGKIYHAGGCINSDCGTPTSALRIYDPASDTWSNGAPMPTPRGVVTGGVINGKLYVTAGLFTDSSKLEIYDPATNSWTVGTNMPVASRWDAAGIVLNDKLYIIGGTTHGAWYSRVDVYDPATDTWGFDTSLPQGIGQAGVAVLNGRVHLVGGTNSVGFSNAHYVFDRLTHTWTTDAPMPTQRANLSGAAVGTTLYAIAGAVPDGTNGGVGTNEAFQDELLPAVPTSKEQCKDDGWKNFPIFKNQGRCVSYVQHLR